MAGTKLENSTYGVSTDNKDEIEMRQNDKYGWLNISLTDDLDISTNSVVDISGVQYIFESDESITGDRYVVKSYLKITADNNTCSAEWYNGDLPEWDYYKRGYYISSSERIVLQIDSKTDEIIDYFDDLVQDNDIEQVLLNQNIYMDILQKSNTIDYAASTPAGNVDMAAWKDQYCYANITNGAAYIFKGIDLLQTITLADIISIDITEHNLMISTSTNIYAWYRSTEDDEFDDIQTVSSNEYTKVKMSDNFIVAVDDINGMIVFRKESTNTWTSTYEKTLSTSTSNRSLDIDGNYIIVSDYDNNSVFVYNRTGDNTWDDGFDIGSLFDSTDTDIGYGVSIFDDYCSVGYTNSTLFGVKTFVRTDVNTWEYDAELKSNVYVDTENLCQCDRYLVYTESKDTTYDNNKLHVYYRDYENNWILTSITNPRAPTLNYSFCKLYDISSYILAADGNTTHGQGYLWNIKYLGD